MSEKFFIYRGGDPGRSPDIAQQFIAEEGVGPARLTIATQTMNLSEIEQAWQAPGKPRIVITIQ